MRADDPRHGTYAGALKHRNDGEKPCDPCRVARNAYMREHRKGNRSTAKRNAARSRALWRLAALHPDEFRDLYVIEYTTERAK